MCVEADVGAAVMARQSVAAIVWLGSGSMSGGRGMWERKGCWEQGKEQGEEHGYCRWIGIFGRDEVREV